MAAIDKIYGMPEQWDELSNWLLSNNPEAVRYLYRRPNEKFGYPCPISNFPTEIDNWLFDHCPIEWVQQALDYQYNRRNENEARNE